MSLVTQIQSLATRAATEAKALRTLINGNASDLSTLTTTAKTTLVAAINELVSLKANLASPDFTGGISVSGDTSLVGQLDVGGHATFSSPATFSSTTASKFSTPPYVGTPTDVTVSNDYAASTEFVQNVVGSNISWTSITPSTGGGTLRYGIKNGFVWIQGIGVGPSTLAASASVNLTNTGAIPSAYCPQAGTLYFTFPNGSSIGYVDVTTTGQIATHASTGAFVGTQSFLINYPLGV